MRKSTDALSSKRKISNTGMALKKKSTRIKPQITGKHELKKRRTSNRKATTPSLRSLRSSRVSTNRSAKSKSSNASRKTLPKVVHTEKLEFKKRDDVQQETFTNSNRKGKKSTQNLRQVKGSLKKIRRVESSPVKLGHKSASKRPIYKPEAIAEEEETIETSPEQ